MTHQIQSSELEQVFQIFCENGFEGMAQAIEILLNEVMKIERAEAFVARPYERSKERRGYANGFK